MKEDIENLQEQIGVVQDRQVNLSTKVEEMTRSFVEKVRNTSEELEEENKEVIKFKKTRDLYEKMTKELERERSNGSYKYQHSIEDFLDRATSLEKASEEIH